MSWTDLARNGRILIVDDAMENVQVLHQALHAEHETLFALSGEQALELARTQRPDLILLDAMMPGMDGYATCTALRASDATRDIPVIFVTVLKSAEDETRALEAGAADFITKPVNAAVVRARVRTHLTVKRQSDILRALTMTDGLTGVANRRCFDEALQTEWRRCARMGEPVALILADIDHFKLFNDAFGHQAGDACLQSVAGAMRRAAARPQDLVSRYGGEEFAILLPMLDLPGAQVVARKILEEVASLAIIHAADSSEQHITVSMGIASMRPWEGPPMEQLIKQADTLLYQAKAAGRNRYCMDN